MIRKILIGALAWTLLISALHVQMNVGWKSLGRQLGLGSSEERAQMVVGFLPVT